MTGKNIDVRSKSLEQLSVRRTPTTQLGWETPDLAGGSEGEEWEGDSSFRRRSR